MNYIETFIAVAPDTKARAAIVPAARGTQKSVAVLEYELIAPNPHVHTQEEVQFAVHVQRLGLTPEDVAARRQELWDDFFSKPMACMRTSPLPKSYGWGLHFDAHGRVALVPLGSPDYERLASDPAIAHTEAMRSKRA